MANPRLCSIPDCGKPVHGHGWCTAHYTRWRNHGDPMKGKTSHGEPLRYFTEVVLLHASDECLPWPYSTSSGYGVFRFAGKTRGVHRLVCEIVNGPEPSADHEAAHTCGNGHLGCCNKRHLVWKTRTENMADQLLHGTRLRGERQNGARLTERDILDIRASRSLKQNVLAKKYGVDQSHISRILSGDIWRHLPDG